MSYSSVVLADSPSSYWRLGDVVNNSIALDTTANHNDGSVVGGVTILQPGALAGDTDTSFLFDGSTGHVLINPAVPFYAAANACSYECWFKTGSAQADACLMNDNRDTGGGLSLSVTLTGLFVRAVDNNTGQMTDLAVVATYADSAWHHVVATVTRGTDTLRLYLDGALIGTAVMVAPNPGDYRASFGLNLGSSLFDRKFGGTLDECAVYPSALSLARVTAHYAAAQPVVVATGAALLFAV